MPWCPICKNEYRAGMTHCAECKVPLVDSLEEAKAPTELLVQMDAAKTEFAEKLVGYLSYSSISASTSIDEESGLLSIYVAPEDVANAKRCFQAFYTVEAEREMENAAKRAAGEPCEEEPDTGEDTKEDKTSLSSSVYVKKEDKYNDYKSSAATFLFFGILGIVFVILNLAGVLTLFTSAFSLIVMGVMFVAFLVIGIASYVKAGKVKEEAAQETEVVEKLTRWLENAVTREELEACEEECSGPELAYLKKLSLLKHTLTEAFPELDDSFTDQFIEDFYNNHYE